jgi:phosphate transport system permease protein
LNKKLFRDYTGKFLSWFATSLTVAICISIVIYLFINGYRHVNPEFIFTAPNPTINEKTSGGISTPIIGTLLLTFIGILLAFPWALATSIYLAEYTKKI